MNRSFSDRGRKCRRHLPSVAGHDYTSWCAYFVTTNTKFRKRLFGRFEDGRYRLQVDGFIVADTWRWLAERYDYVRLNAFAVMPDHFHGILIMNPRRAAERTKIKPLCQLVGAFKMFSAKRINVRRKTQGSPVWQAEFYHRIIRSDKQFFVVREYILNQVRVGIARKGS